MVPLTRGERELDPAQSDGSSRFVDGRQSNFAFPTFIVALPNWFCAYTGLRVGVVTALSLGDALGIPVLGVVSHDVLAAGRPADSPDAVLVATDARRKEVFWSRYVGGRRVLGPAVDRPDVVARQWPGVPVVGDGASLYAGLLGLPLHPLLPSAAVLAALAMQRLSTGGDFEPPQPLYLRRPDAVERAASRTVTP